MRPTALSPKVLVSELAEARRLAREGPWPGSMPPQGGRTQTALEAQFDRVENLLDVLDALTGAPVRRLARRSTAPAATATL